jgi:hypothetical protein
MAGRLTRFLKVESPHQGGEAPHHEVATKARFSGEGSGLATEPDLGEQPFMRCPRCEADNSRYVERCYNCQASLSGEDVKEWNARLWAERKAADAAMQAARPLAPASSPSPEELRARGEAIAQQILESERRRAWWLPQPIDPTPIGIRLLAALPSTRARVIAGTVMVGAFVFATRLAFSASPSSRFRIGGFIVAGLLVLLFTPNIPRRRRWWDWY